MIEIFLFALVQKDFSSADEDVKAVELHIFLRLKEYPKKKSYDLSWHFQNFSSYLWLIDFKREQQLKRLAKQRVN